MAAKSLFNLTNILLFGGLVYFSYTAYTLSEICRSPSCSGGPKCLDSLLHVGKDSDGMALEVRIALTTRATGDWTDLLKQPVLSLPVPVIPAESFSRELNISIPSDLRRNGTMYVIAGLVRVFAGQATDIRLLSRDADEFTQYLVPKAEVINLLGGGEPEKKSDKKKSSTSKEKPVTHWRKRLDILLPADESPIPPIDQMPPELAGSVTSYRHEGRSYYIPPVHIDRLVWRESDLVSVKSTDLELPLTINIYPSTLGRFRFRLTIYQSLQTLKDLGFGDHDMDDIKSLFGDTNLALLLVTVLVSTLHLIFDFLAFKNDVQYWRGRRTTSGISTRGVAWRALSSFIVFLYLIDENASLLVAIPIGISVILELWKLSKALRVRFSWKRGFSRSTSTAEELRTESFDAQAMKYLGIALVPLLAGSAIYSLAYVPHRSWYSWTLNSLVNAVYAFGFLFMLPQLFINYKLKSVAHLAWRVFIYRALNTFIDDLFAFIITMPTAHRVACFRDDIVFLIYLYQRYLYPVDPTRPSEMPSADDSTVTSPQRVLLADNDEHAHED